MAQVTQRREIKRTRLEAKNEAVTVAQSATETELLNLDVSGLERLAVQVAVTGQALDEFVIEAAPPDGALAVYFSAAADFTSPAGLMIDASSDLTTLAAAATGWFVMDVRGLSKVRVSASSGNVAGSTVSAYAGGL